MQKRGMAAVLLTLVLLAALLPRALAAGRVDLNRELRLHLSYQKDARRLPGRRFRSTAWQRWKKPAR